MNTLIIQNVDFELLEKQIQGAKEYVFGDRYDSDCIIDIITMLDGWSTARRHKAEARRIVLDSTSPGAKIFTTEQAIALYRCSTCEEGGYCGYDCVESRTGSIRCLHCGERIWFAHSLSDHHNPFTCPYCKIEQSNKHLDRFDG